jgi:hypothetical protein
MGKIAWELAKSDYDRIVYAGEEDKPVYNGTAAYGLNNGWLAAKRGDFPITPSQWSDPLTRNNRTNKYDKDLTPAQNHAAGKANDYLFWQPENNRNGYDHLMSALLERNKKNIVQAFNYLIQPLSDETVGDNYDLLPWARGTYLGRVYDPFLLDADMLPTSDLDTHHPRGVFMGALAKGINMLEVSGRCPTQINLERYKQKFYRSAKAIMTSEGGEEFFNVKYNVNQRLFSSAMAYWGGIWGNDSALFDIALKYIDDLYLNRFWVTGRQDDNFEKFKSRIAGYYEVESYQEGTLPEAGGFDQSYQTVSMEFLADFLSHREDSTIRDMLNKAATRYKNSWVPNPGNMTQAEADEVYLNRPYSVDDVSIIPNYAVLNNQYEPLEGIDNGNSSRTKLVRFFGDKTPPYGVYGPNGPYGNGIDQYGHRAKYVGLVLERSDMVDLAEKLWFSAPSFGKPSDGED